MSAHSFRVLAVVIAFLGLQVGNRAWANTALPACRDRDETDALFKGGIGNCVWQTTAGKLRIESKPLRLRAYTPSGKLLWAKIDDPRAAPNSIYRMKKLGHALMIEVSRDGMMNRSTFVVPSNLVRLVDISGFFLASSVDKSALLFSVERNTVPNDDEGYAVQRLTLGPPISLIQLHFPPPLRARCGKSNSFYDRAGTLVAAKYVGRFIYVAREDECGYFMTRFDWVNPQARPLSYAVPAPE